MNDLHLSPSGHPALRRAPFRLDGWSVWPDRHLIERNGRQIRLEPKSMRVLALLAARLGETVTRDELIASAWDGRIVSDDAVNRQLAKLRAAFDDDPKTPRLFETVPKLGVRLLREIEPLEPAAGARRSYSGRWAWSGAALGIVAGAVWLGWKLWPEARVPADAISLRPIASARGLELQPALSPGGHMLAYAHRPEGSDAFAIYLRDLAGDTPRRLTTLEGHALYPAWSPDGERLAFVHEVDDACRLRVIALAGGVGEEVGACREAHHGGLTWADGLIYADRETPHDPFRLWSLEPDTGEVRALTDPPRDARGDSLPAISPAGARLAFQRSTTLGVADAWLLDLASGDETRLTHDSTKLSGITWHPGGERLVFSSNRAGGVYGLWEIDVGGGGLRRWSVLAEAQSPGFAREREVLVFEQWQSAVALRVLDLASGEERALPASTRWDFWPALSPDGEWLAFVSDRSGAAELWLSRADGSEPRRLTQFEGAYVQQPAWTQDGQALLFSAPVDGQFDVFRVDMASGGLERLTETVEDERFPAPASDAEGIVFSRRTANGWLALERDSGGRERTLVEDAFRIVAELAGEWQYFSHADRDGLWRQSVGAGEPELVAVGLRPVDAGSWQLARGQVVFVERIDPNKPELVWLAADTLAETRRLPLDTYYYRAGFAVSADGDRIVYGVLESEESDLFLYAKGG